MSESSPNVAPHERASAAQAEPFVLPQRVIDVIRACLHALSRIFWRVSYRGVENIPQTGGVIIASNHQTYLDPIWMSLPVKRPIRYLAWSESFEWPIVGKVITLLGAWPIQIKKADRTAIRRSRQWLKSGGAVVIFPEGGRCLPDGELLKFEAGAARMALEANVPILPITIRGGHRVWPKGYRLPRFFRKVELVFHPLQYIEMREGEDARQSARRETERLAATIRSEL
ncbi:MAG TPA: lysophospholipid acyltransferase family protein [Pyrinomonadaceae bacterium]|nr:lysophospholipid acyltransferase family protein [Pyrinomonadaceae bacterium]